jgi:glycosyltransferase involved in cell wall biosynthesis
MLARLNSIKDHRTLIRALPAVLERFPNVILEFAGGGEEEPALRALVAELQLEPAVRFLGDLSNVYEAMAKWDLFAYATTEREGLGNAVSEAMMLALPCVLTDIGPIHEFAGDGTATRMVPPHDPNLMADALIELIPDAGERARLSAAGVGWAFDRFHPSVFARRHAKILGLPLPKLATRVGGLT